MSRVFGEAFLLSSIFATTLAMGQYVVSARAGMIGEIVGGVFLDDKPVVMTVSPPRMKDGQSLRTENGRAEILLSPSIFLRIGKTSVARMESTSLRDTRVTVERGSALIEVVRVTKGSRIRIRLGSSVTEFERAGLYRFEVSAGVIQVYGGEAKVQSGSKTVKAKRWGVVKIADGLTASKFDLKVADELHQWSAQRSFKMFDENSETRARETNWQLGSLGSMWNEDFGSRFYSADALADFNRKLAEDAAQAAMMKAIDDAAERAMRQQRQQQQSNGK